jgi:hypothetical protein
LESGSALRGHELEAADGGLCKGAGMLETDARPSVTLRIAEEDAFSARRRHSRPFVLHVERKERGADRKLESDLGSLGSMRQAVENEVGEDLAKIGPSSHPHACGAARQR